MSTVRERKRAEGVELRPLASAEDDYDDDVGKSEHPFLEKVLYKLHALLWIVIASALAVYVQLFEVIVDGHPPNDEKRQLNR